MKPAQKIINKLFSSLEKKSNQGKFEDACQDLLDFLKKYPDCSINEIINVDGKNLLVLGCLTTNLEMVNLLLARSDINVNQQSSITNKDNTQIIVGPLSVVVSKGSERDRAICKSLMRKDGFLFPKSTDPVRFFFQAAQHGHEGIVQYFIENKINLDAQDLKAEGQTALHYAAEKGHKGIVNLLLDAGADINSKTIKNISPLFIAVCNNHIELVELLINRGADLTTTSGSHPLHTASTEGYGEIVEILLKANCNSNIKTTKGSITPLYIAAEKGHEHIVKILLKYGADVNLGIDNNVTPLMAAAHRGHLEIIKILIEHHALLNVASKEGNQALVIASAHDQYHVVEHLLKLEELQPIFKDNRTHLWHAASGGHFKTVKTILQIDKSIINQVDNKGVSPLYIAAENGHLDIVQLLIAEGADFNLVNKYNYSPLFIACATHRTEIVKLLVQQPNIIIDPLENLQDSKPSAIAAVNPLAVAADRGFLDILKIIVKKIKASPIRLIITEQALFAAVIKNQFPVIQYLLTEGVTVNLLDPEGKTPLWYACCANNKSIVDWLINKGADVNLSNKAGQTPLNLVCSTGYLELAKLLKNHGANLNHGDNYNFTSLHRACINGQLDTVKWLLAEKVNVNTLTLSDSTPFIDACITRHESIINLLLENNVDVNQPTKGSQVTALHVACLNGDKKLVKKLIDHKANINATNREGETPLFIAVDRAILAHQTQYASTFEIGDQVLIQYLLKMGADIHQCNAKGQTVLELALESGYKELIEMLLQHQPQETLFKACLKGKIAIVKLCIDKNISLHTKNQELLPIEAAAQFNHQNIVALLIENGAVKTREDVHEIIHMACSSDAVDVISYIVEKFEISSNELNKIMYNNTLIYSACEVGSIDTIKYLINREVDLDKSSEQKMTPLHIASLNGDFEILELLLQHQARTDKTNADGMMPLHLAYAHSEFAVVELLLKVTKKFPALLIACKLGQKYIVEQLLKIDADKFINKTDLNNDSKTALHYACEQGSVAIASLLIAAGAKINKPTESGLTPLHIACRNGHLNLVAYLILNTEVNVNEANIEDGKTALTYAMLKNNQAMIALLVKHGASISSNKEKSNINKAENFLSDGKAIPTHTLLFSAQGVATNKNKAPREELARLADITDEEVKSLSLKTLPKKQNDCTFGNGALTLAKKNIIEIMHNAHIVPNIYFYMKPSVLAEVKSSGSPDIFDALLKAPVINKFNGLKSLRNIHPDLWELKQQHNKARIYCMRFKSDSSDADKQGSVLVTIKFSEKGAHTLGEIKSIIQSLKTNPEFKIFFVEDEKANNEKGSILRQQGFA